MTIVFAQRAMALRDGFCARTCCVGVSHRKFANVPEILEFLVMCHTENLRQFQKFWNHHQCFCSHRISIDVPEIRKSLDIIQTDNQRTIKKF
jgi:hypothetical protein